MLEDKMLLWKFRHGSTDALRRIYDKYKNDLLGLAIALSHDRTAAEDALHDVFCSLAQRADKLRLKTSLKSYLSTCIANRIRDIKRKKSIQTVELDQAGQISTEDDQPDTLVMSAELSRRGYLVTTADSGQAALAQAPRADLDAAAEHDVAAMLAAVRDSADLARTGDEVVLPSGRRAVLVRVASAGR